MKRLRVVWLCLAWCFVLAPSARADDPTFDELKAALKEWRSSFSTIRILWHTWNDELTRKLRPEIDPNMPLEGNYGGREEFAWADFGAYTHRLDDLSAAYVTSRSYWGNDGLRPWDATTSQGQPDHLFQIRRWKPIPDRPILSKILPVAIAGLWVPNLGLWLPDILEKHDPVTLDRFEARNGHRHAVVRIEWALQRAEFWLNPDHGWLPTYSHGFSRKTPEADWKATWEWIADEVKTFDSNIRFPVRGKLFASGVLQQEWAIQEVEINIPRTRVDFGPPAPHKGTKLYDHVTGDFEWHGSPKKTNTQSQAKVKPTGIPAETVGDGEIAVVSSSLGVVQWLLFAVASVSLIVGVFLRWRH